MTDSASNPSVSIRLEDNWDAALSYDVLEQDAATAARPIFVGRKELLGPIVNAIGQPDRRGTYLISGYRGAGKTSLVIEAARQARAKLEPEWHILPVVLNVSEVSASLSDASRSTVGPLQIDARRLLTALLRQLRNRLPVEGTEEDADKAKLARKIEWAYTKADAAQYVQRNQQRLENRRSELIESRIRARLPNVLKLLAGVALVAAVAVGAAVVSGWVGAIVAALVGGATLSFGWSRTVSRSSEGRDTAEIELTTDNSVHQLENELKDIFTELNKRKLRTLVVLEELDKVDDSEGKQLEAVIRYFKNLFTQAPALFFFITDKQYYDLIETRIDEARRNRTYSIEHTFFTHRVFVNRPTVGACLEYLWEIAADPAEQAAIGEIVKAESNRVRVLNSMDLRERLLRVLLFRAEDHIFDLKNAIRGYVTVHDNQSFLECDHESLPSREQALATFQFLVERKARSYGFRGGRDYANEVLRNCLFAVFDDMDPDKQRELSEFGPRKGASGDQLGAAEEKQIADAVSSLIQDLERGGALEHDPPRFTWKENAAIRFSPTAELDPHEKDLVAGLRRTINLLSVLTEGGALSGVLTDPNAAPELVKQLEKRIKEVESAAVAIPNEEALTHTADSEARFDRLLDQVYHEHLTRLTARMGRKLEPVTSTGSSRVRVWRLPRPEGSGEVLLVQGSGERVMQAVVNHVANTPGPGRFAIVRLVPAVEQGPAWEVQRRDIRQAWEEQLESLAGAHTYVHVTLPLDEYLATEGVKERWTQATADELLIAELWVDRAWRRFAVTSEETQDIPAGPYLFRPSGSDVAEESSESLERVLTDWVASNDRVLCWVTEEPTLDAVATLFGRPLTGRWAGNVYLPATASVPETAAAALWDLPVEEAGSRLASLARLIEARRVILGMNRHIYEELPNEHALSATAAVALHAPRRDRLRRCRIYCRRGDDAPCDAGCGDVIQPRRARPRVGSEMGPPARRGGRRERLSRGDGHACPLAPPGGCGGRAAVARAPPGDRRRGRDPAPRQGDGSGWSPGHGNARGAGDAWLSVGDREAGARDPQVGSQRGEAVDRGAHRD